MRNITVKLFEIWTSGSGGDVILTYFLSRALVGILFIGTNTFKLLWQMTSLGVFL